MQDLKITFKFKNGCPLKKLNQVLNILELDKIIDDCKQTGHCGYTFSDDNLIIHAEKTKDGHYIVYISEICGGYRMKVVADLIKEYEGFKQYPYKCPGGYWTIGYGSRYYPGGAEVSENDPSITRQIAEKMLNDYLSKYVLPCIDKLENARAAKRKTKSFKNYSLPAKFTQNQIEALASLIYNISIKQFEKSKCYAGIVDDDLAAIYKEWDWIYVNGKVQAGLCKRRAAEKDCFFNF